MKSRSTSFLVIIGIILFGLFVWPTMYKYDKLNQKWPVKINRITGSAQVLYQNGWQSLDGNGDESANQSDMLKPSDTSVTLGIIKINNLYVDGDKVSGEVVNTSNRTILLKELGFDVYDSNNHVSDNRPFCDLFGGVRLQPNETMPFNTNTIGTNHFLIEQYKIRVDYVNNYTQ